MNKTQLILVRSLERKRWFDLKTWDELMTEIYKGEKIDMECKRAENNVPDSVYETYSSFANTKGGI
jgi:hypothetical protein